MNFPPGILETQALLLHGNDRVRFLPRPGYFWSGTSIPSITVKAWDASVGSVEQHMKESSRMNINTDPFTDTQQSQYSPIGHFSTGTAIIRATRFGCDGVINSGMIHDACCMCGGSGAGCAGCDGTTGSNKLYDACDTCGGSETACLGCDFVPSSSTVAGSCEECVSSVNTPTGSGLQETTYPVTSFQDCAGACFGVGLVDDCGVCSGGNTSHRYNSDK